jgi:tRNA pseudouridine38-40 synthase
MIQVPSLQLSFLKLLKIKSRSYSSSSFVMRYFIHLAYDGSGYCGWQVQKNAPSVQQTINEALQKLLVQHISSCGCGRTDAGVHAKDFYMHFDSEHEIADLDNLLFRLNCVLPESIAVYRIIPMHEKAHARFDASERSYEYFIHFNKSPFIHKYSYYQGFYKINWEKVIEAADFLQTIEDFTSLCLPSVDFKTNICKLTRVQWQVLPAYNYVLKPFDEIAPSKPLQPPFVMNTGEILRFTISSNRFLRGMVRKIVGTLITIGKGKMSVEEFKEIVVQKKDFRIHFLAPPNGLFLSKIKYPYFEADSLKSAGPSVKGPTSEHE